MCAAEERRCSSACGGRPPWLRGLPPAHPGGRSDSRSPGLPEIFIVLQRDFHVRPASFRNVVGGRFERSWSAPGRLPRNTPVTGRTPDGFEQATGLLQDEDGGAA